MTARARRWSALAVALVLAALPMLGPPAATATPMSGATAISGATAMSDARGLSGATAKTTTAKTATKKPAPPTIVSFTFDDGDADQMIAERQLAAAHLAGTFYIITGAIDTIGYLTRADLDQMAAQGQEIGGHTVSHLDLQLVSLAEATRQVCESRDILTGWGFHATSFAYPNGATNPAVESIVRECGYDSARTITGLASPECDSCQLTESTPPADPYGIRAPDEVTDTWTLATLENLVTTAERNGGGWLPLIIHHVCASGDCGSLSVSAQVLQQFIDWLPSQTAHGVTVKTVGQVMGGPVRPTVPVAPAARHGVRNPTLATTGSSGLVDADLESLASTEDDTPRCWMEAGYGQNTATWQRLTNAHAGNPVERVTVTGYVNGDAKLLPQFDLGDCAPEVSAGTGYQLSAAYTATARVQFAVYYRNPDGRWLYWTSSPYFPATRTWSTATWRTPPVPAGGSGLSFGLAIGSNGTLTTDDYGLAPSVPAVTGKPGGSGWLSLQTLLIGAAVLIVLFLYLRGARTAVTRRLRSARAGGSAADSAETEAAAAVSADGSEQASDADSPREADAPAETEPEPAQPQEEGSNPSVTPAG